MEVKDVAGISLAPGRTAQQQRELAVSGGVLGKIVINQQRVLAGITEVFAYRASAVRRDELQRRRLGGCRGDHRGVFHRAGALQPLDDLRHGRTLLADRDVDAVDVLPALIDDRVDRNRGLADVPIADDQLALAAPDLEQRVDRLDPGLQRLLDRLAMNDAGRFELDSAPLGRLDRTLVVDRLAQHVDDASQKALAHRHFGDSAGALDLVAFTDRLRIAEQGRAHVVFLEVQHDSIDLMWKLEQLAGGRVLKPVDARDTVAATEHPAGLAHRDGALKALDFIPQDLADLGWSDFSHKWSRALLLPAKPLLRLRKSGRQATVVNPAFEFGNDSAHERLVHLHGRHDLFARNC